MAILNEYPVIGPDVKLLIFGVLLLACGISAVIVMCLARSDKEIIIAALLATICIMSSINCFMEYTNPDTYGPTGKTRIEATFARGDIPVYYLNKYKVIDKVNGNVYILEEK